MTPPPSTTLTDALDSPTFQAIARAGSLDRDELIYQLEKRGVELDELELLELAEQGHIEEGPGDTYSVKIPERRQRHGGRPKHGEPDSNRGWSDQEIIDRVKLWALVCGRPPAQANWNPDKTRKQRGAILVRAKRMQQLIDLYEQGDFPSQVTVRQHFGSMNAALVAAGFEARAPGRQPGEPLMPGQPAKRWGQPQIDGALRRVKYAREKRARDDRSTDEEEELAAALIELATAAFNEAEQLRPWEPDVDA